MEEVTISPTMDPMGIEPQAGEQLYQRSSRTAVSLGPTTDSPTWGSEKGTENP